MSAGLTSCAGPAPLPACSAQSTNVTDNTATAAAILLVCSGHPVLVLDGGCRAAAARGAAFPGSRFLPCLHISRHRKRHYFVKYTRKAVPHITTIATIAIIAMAWT